MFLPTRDGILCDFCGISYKNNFTYYSVEAVELKIVNSMKISHKNNEFGKDMCQSCYERLIEDVAKFIGQTKHNHIKCDLSKNYKTGTFNYWIVNFDKIDVSKDREDQPAIIDRQVMDINLLDFKLLSDRINKVETKDGVWA